MAKERTHRIALIGAGPRGTSVLERLLAHAAAQRQRGPGVGLHIDLIDPYPPGAGHVWRPGQSRHFLMNTPSLFPTLSPGTMFDAAPVAGLSFEQWRQQLLQGGPDERVGLSDDDVKELAGLDAAGFASRALYGRYLRWMFECLAAHCRGDVSLTVHATEAVRVNQTAGGLEIELNDGPDLVADSVVLALGHLPAGLRPDQQALLSSAARLGLRYRPPAIPADVDWSAFPAGEPVLARGLGLNFFDMMMQLTVGRGGKFVESGDGPDQALRYEPSGAEPVLYGGSRRGTPYRAKANLTTYIPRRVKLRFLTPERAGRLAASGIQPAFDHDLWPLMHRDAVWTYYQTMARVRPSAFRQGPDTFMPQLDEILSAGVTAGAEPWERVADRLIDQHVAPDDQLHIRHLAHPFSRRHFESPADHDAAVLQHLEADAAGSAAGEDDPLKMAIGALNAARSVVKTVVADGGLTDSSWLNELRGWFEPFVEGLASGPPALRIEQIAALARAGLVHFIGPDPKFHIDERTGLFTASSPWVRGGAVAAGQMVEAMMPANNVTVNVSPLLRQLLDDGLARPKMMVSIEETPVATSGLDVTAPPYRLRMMSGRHHEGLYALGLQLSSVQWGTAIAAQAGGNPESGARTLKDADDIAADIMRRATDAGGCSMTVEYS
ncbi:FAD/NAD(P)-binding protein [Arthrobacter castelli]|uniref:FAD/NAD(P)-binding protein n=1 Tax=Arthrobacter castelli TaxID=271431 RepID=UPI00041E63BF|nr:FAD/NAD(P)-binding protein [Arthrobacter castelli]